MSKKLYVGNLRFQATEEEIQALFASFGEVEKVTLITDPYSGRSRGFAFVEMASDEAANKAREGLNGKPRRRGSSRTGPGVERAKAFSPVS